MLSLLNLADAVATHARLTPQKVGVRDSRRALTFAQWNERATRLASGLLSLGLRKGDRVGLLAYNRVEWMELYAALARAGLVAVPINFRLAAEEVLYILQHSEAGALVVEDDLADRIEPIRERLAIPSERCVLMGAPRSGRWVPYETLMDAPSSMAFEDVGPDDPCALMYTSGTTGRPKGAIRSHGGNALIAMSTALEMGFTRDDTALLVMPLCHANSLYFSHTFTHRGATCIVDDSRSFDPANLLERLATGKVTFTSLVPTHFIMMLGLPAEVLARHDVGAVAKLLVSSAPARKDTKVAILRHFSNARLYELYGSTEAGWVTLLRPEEQLARLGSVGREWGATGAIRFLDDDGVEVPDGEVGELHSRTPYVFEGYWRDPDRTRDAFRGAWCTVGDMGRRDADGFIHLVDRKSNMIISGGENVYPFEVETVLGTHPKIKDVAVVGVPDAKWGEAVLAVVVLHAGQAATEVEIVEWCRDRMAGYRRPRQVRIVTEDALPRTATGKILHRVLRDRMASGLDAG